MFVASGDDVVVVTMSMSEAEDLLRELYDVDGELMDKLWSKLNQVV